MKLLLDTHFLVWLAVDRPRLRACDLELIVSPDNKIYVSTLSIWEIRIKWNKIGKSGQRRGPISPTDAIAFSINNCFNLAPLNPEDCAAPLDMPIAHGDPYDEMLLVHAHRLGCRLLTRDRALREHRLAYPL